MLKLKIDSLLNKNYNNFNMLEMTKCKMDIYEVKKTSNLIS